MRAYIPADMWLLARLMQDPPITFTRKTAYAVTQADRDANPHSPEEQLQGIARSEAVYESLRLIGDKRPRRVVIALDVLDDTVEVSHMRGTYHVVLLSGPVRLSDVSAVYVDDPDAAVDLLAAKDALPMADLGSLGADAEVARASHHKLRHYAAEDIPTILARDT